MIAMQRQTAITAYLKSRQLLLFVLEKHTRSKYITIYSALYLNTHIGYILVNNLLYKYNFHLFHLFETGIADAIDGFKSIKKHYEILNCAFVQISIHHIL